jgi:hypothetical protein
MGEAVWTSLVDDICYASKRLGHVYSGTFGLLEFLVFIVVLVDCKQVKWHLVD